MKPVNLENTRQHGNVFPHQGEAKPNDPVGFDMIGIPKRLLKRRGDCATLKTHQNEETERLLLSLNAKLL